MGEIIYSILVGGFLVLTGVSMNLYLKWEEKKWLADKKEGRKAGGL